MLKTILIHLGCLMVAVNGWSIQRSYGTWDSPVTAEKIAEGSKHILNLQVDGDATYWCELRPTNQGRYTIVRLDQSGMKDMTAAEFNCRTFVHEYGGGAFTVKDGVIYSSNGKDHRVYRIEEGKEPVALTDGSVRFADFHSCPHGLLAVGEKHQNGSHPTNFLALIDPKKGTTKILATGDDFYSNPVVSPDGKKIAWISWNHPNMPWNESDLWVATITPHGLKDRKKISSGSSIFQPLWSPTNELYFVSDKTGWWNIYRADKNGPTNICPMEAEVGEPLWFLGASTYGFLGDQILFTYNKNGLWKLGLLDPKKKTWKPLNRACSTIHQIRGVKDRVRFLECYGNQGEKLIEIDAQGRVKVLNETPLKVEEKYISQGKHIAYPSGNRTAYAFYYAPRNDDFTASSNEKPPLVVMIHGGPTAQASGNFAMEKQFWTSRGFAVLDVNYGGSTGYGRDYRNLLNHNWGIVDIEDCVRGVHYLASQGLVDPNKVVIRGGSAGGYTTLAALAFTKTFKAGASYFGVADLTMLAQDTHKFESRYLEQLLGKYPEEKEVWEKRSPIGSVDQIEAPLILFQGEDDAVVPKNQAICIHDALKKKGQTVELHIYPGEEHGFRKAEHIIHSLNRELEFYLETFNK
jgi:dipeptidyl aminopeptidase/acylaminoacyl peptidase